MFELDTFYFSELDKTLTAYCVIDNIKITDIINVPQTQKLHSKLLNAYKNRQFRLCRDLIENLQGSLSGELDSFYTELLNRIQTLEQEFNDTTWSSIIVK